MILDNRKPVPDIIVSKIKPVPSHSSPRHLYVTGNNNGSPRHVPKNGNIYTEENFITDISYQPKISRDNSKYASRIPFYQRRKIRDHPQKIDEESHSSKFESNFKKSDKSKQSSRNPYDINKLEYCSNFSLNREKSQNGNVADFNKGYKHDVNKLENFSDFSLNREKCQSNGNIADKGIKYGCYYGSKMDLSGDIVCLMDTDRSEEENDRIDSSTSLGDINEISSDLEEMKLLTDDESESQSKMIIVRCKESTYLTKIITHGSELHGLKVVGKVDSAMNEIEGGIRNANSSLTGAELEFDHEADYQWLLDYEYRESYCRSSLGGKDGTGRVSVLQPDSNTDSYETISRNIDANLAQIDMDDFRSEDINQFLNFPASPVEYQVDPVTGFENYYKEDLNDSSSQKINNGDEEEDSGASGDLSIYQSGPLFSPLHEPVPPSFSVDSLDSESIHEDLILTCQANKDNYTIAFEGSFIQVSENSEYPDGSETWSSENIEDNLGMAHSDQPYTTWSRVSRRSSNTPEIQPQRHVNSPVPSKDTQKKYLERTKTDDSKSSSMPNLMRRSLMKRSTETGQFMKVYDLQNSLRSSQLTNSKENTFSLVRLFIKQKSMGREASSFTSSFTDPSNCSSSENQSGTNVSSDWPMNSQSETDMERSSSPANVAHNNKINRIEDTYGEDKTVTGDTEAIINNNNNAVYLENTENILLHLNNIDNMNSFDDNVKDTCSKPPMTSPIREEPEGMDVSMGHDMNIVNELSKQNLLENPKHIKKPKQDLKVERKPLKSEKVRRTEHNNKNENNRLSKPKPRPRLLKQVTDQCLQTSSNLKVSAAVNTSKILDKKEVYVYYPNYALPNLDFLKDKKYSFDTKIFLVPQRYNADKKKSNKTSRPMSQNDMITLKRENFSHVKDWQSLNYLLPKELKEILMDSTDCMETVKPSFCQTVRRPVSCDFSSKASSGLGGQPSSTCRGSSTSIGTQPSSGYRGSSTMLMDSEEYPVEEPRDLPKGVLRKYKSLKEAKPKETKSEQVLKRRSMPEMNNVKDQNSLHKQSASQKTMRCSCINQCTGFCSKGLRSKNIIQPEELPNINNKINEDEFRNIRAKVSNNLSKKTVISPISDLNINNKSHVKSMHISDHRKTKFSPMEEDPPPMLYDLSEKKTLIISVRSAVEKLVSQFKSISKDKKLGSSFNSSEVANTALEKLCPAIYALLSDGLLPSLHSLFGKITNSVWKVVETTSQIGPSTKALHDLVMTLNSEECLSEGPIKFNAFIFGLLNLRSLDAWLSYLRTREVALQKHFHPEAFLYLANTAMRGLYDDLLLAMKPLALLPFHLDILFEYKALHASLLKMEERLLQQNSIQDSMANKPTVTALFDHILTSKETKEFRNTATQQDRLRAFMRAIDPQERRERSKSPRPRSCFGEEGIQDVESSVKKRWSTVQLGSKLVTAIDKLLSDEDYTDSLDNKSDGTCTPVSEKSATDKDTENEKSLATETEGERFRRLQLKWERMTDKYDRQSPVCRSRIPRPVTSPQRPCKTFTTRAPRPVPRRSKDPSPDVNYLRKKSVSNSRASSVPSRDQVISHRNDTRKSNEPRSISHGRRLDSVHRYVQTLHHRLATDNGHLSFNRGDLLAVVVDVDEKFLLCCLNDRKGLVPRSSVVPFNA